MVGKEDNLSNDLGPCEDEISVLEKLDIEVDDINLDSKSSDTRNYNKNILSGCISHNWLLESELSSSLRKVRLNDWEFATGILISNIEYNSPRFQIDNPFYHFHD